MNILEARTFFSSGRPPGLPGDAPAPDWNALFERARSLGTAHYPLTEMRSILERENARLGAAEAALDAIRAIGPDTLFVVAGQQAGLFGGPLYTLYKALHAVRLAERLTGETGRRVVPVFWVASDDHDFEEVKRLGVRTGDGSPFWIDYAPSLMISGAPVGEILLDEGILGAVQALTDRLPRGDRSEYYLKILRRIWTPGVRWTDAFSAQMAALLSRRGLVMLDPRWSGVKFLFRDIMRAEIENPLASTSAVNTAAVGLDSVRSRRRSLRKPENSTNLFLETGGVRMPVLVERNAFRAGGDVFPKGDLLSLLEDSPERFSPGAALRPVCQDAILPVIALIAGPGERVYLEQVRSLYPLFGVNGSLPWPRASFTLIDHRTLRAAEKEGIPVQTLFKDGEGIRAELASASFPAGLRDRLDALERTVGEGFDSLSEALRGLDTTLTESVKKERNRAVHSVENIRGRAVRAHKNRLKIAESRTLSAQRFLLPDGEPQERRFGADAAVTILGPDGLAELLPVTSPGEEFHRIVLPE